MRRPGTPLAVVGVLALAIGGCGQTPTATPSSSSVLVASPTPSPPATATPAPTIDRATGWQNDLTMLVPEMDERHPELTHGVSRTELDAAVTALQGRIAGATDDELMVGVLSIVAMVSRAGCDAHTGAFIWGTGRYPVDSLPLRLWLFEDEVVIVDALPPYEDLIGARIDAIAGPTTAEVLAALRLLIPRDNDQTVRLLTPRYLLIPQVLRGLDLAGSGAITLALTNASGAKRTVDVAPIPMADYNAWAGPYGLHLPEDPDVLYLSNIGEALWWQVLPDAETLYVQYNRVDPLPLSALNGLRAAIADRDIFRVIVDLRHNYGGELSALEPFATALYADSKVDRADGLYVITGRNTFSAGSLLVARLKDEGVTIVGEPMSGCPTTYGDPSDVLLPYSAIDVSVATELSVGVRADDDRLTIEPDVIAPLTLENWLDKRDPALEAIVLVVP